MRTGDPTERSVRRWTIAGLGLVLAVAIAVAATYTPLFAAGDIRLRLPPGIARTDVLSLARLDERSNVFHLDTGAVERRLEGDPRILEASVTTSLPDRVSIEIVPRIAVAVVGTPEALVGADGTVIGPAGPGADLPALLTGDGRPPVSGNLERAAATAGALGATLREQVEAVVVEPDGTLRVRLAAGFSAMLGDASELEAKVESLAALLAWIEDEGVTVMSADLTVPGSPTARLDRGDARVAVP
jgi:cell division septal protein FtsQ